MQLKQNIWMIYAVLLNIWIKFPENALSYFKM